MALGYQRIHDLSPLSLKLLNDQLEQLWKKMMGGLEERDLTGQLQASINAAVTQGNFSSMIEQYADEIRVSVGSTGADNIARNGDASFGTEGWTASGTTLSVVDDATQGKTFSLSGTGALSQNGIELRKGIKYALTFNYTCSGGLHAAVKNVLGNTIAQGENESSAEWMPYTLLFTAESAGEHTLEINVTGTAKITGIMLFEGTASAYRQNPNELHNASITLTDDRVAIDTEHFDLILRNDGGEIVTEMNADSQGFHELYIANNLFMRGKPVQLGPGRYDLWVHPDADPAGERRFFYAGDSAPPTLEGLFPDVQEAIDYIPHWCEGEVVVHVWGGAAWQYPTSKLEISGFFGGGRLELRYWGGTHFTMKRVEVRNNSLEVMITGAYINSCGPNDCFHITNSVCSLLSCKINGRGVLDGPMSAGYVASEGALAMLSSCEAHNCTVASRATNGGRLSVTSCAGSGNITGASASTGGIITQANSVFQATNAVSEVSGGKVLTTCAITAAGTLPATTPMEYYASFKPTMTASYLYAYAKWTTAPDTMLAGPGNYGAMWFNMSEIKQQLYARTIVFASLALRRKGLGGPACSIPVSFHTSDKTAPTGFLIPYNNYGTIGSWAWGEKRNARLPESIIPSMMKTLDPECCFIFSAPQDVAFAGINESTHENLPLLEVVYR